MRIRAMAFDRSSKQSARRASPSPLVGGEKEDLGDSFSSQSAGSQRWLSIVGIGEDGIAGLSAVARDLVRGAEIVFGGRRHLALAAELIRGAARPWPSPFAGAVEAV